MEQVRVVVWVGMMRVGTDRMVLYEISFFVWEASKNPIQFVTNRPANIRSRV